MKYVLDTNIVTRLLKGDERVLSHLADVEPSDVGMMRMRLHIEVRGLVAAHAQRVARRMALAGVRVVTIRALHARAIRLASETFGGERRPRARGQRGGVIARARLPHDLRLKLRPTRALPHARQARANVGRLAALPSRAKLTSAWSQHAHPGKPLGRSFRVKLLPTLIFLRDGKEVARVVRPTQASDLDAAFQPLR